MAPETGFTLTSPDFEPNGTVRDAQVFDGWGATGGNVSPELSWSGAPPETASFAVTLYDPDAPTGSGWWHWLVFNIPATVSRLPAGAGAPSRNLAPPGSVQSRTDYGTVGYGGPCPPPGDRPHRYVLTVFALKVARLDLGPDASGALVGFHLNANALARASVTSYYGR
jgi:Raf kinase inhibitor-like YbhB/YbcL family protein